MTPAGKARARRVLLRIAIAGACVVAVWFAFAAWVEHSCVYGPPAIPPPPEGAVVTRASDGLSRFHSSWLHEDEGIQELFLEGDAVQRGYAMANLCAAGLEAISSISFWLKTSAPNI